MPVVINKWLFVAFMVFVISGEQSKQEHSKIRVMGCHIPPPLLAVAIRNLFGISVLTIIDFLVVMVPCSNLSVNFTYCISKLLRHH